MPSNPSAEEQLLLELINRFRMHPGEEADWLTGANAPAGVQSAINYFGVSVSALHTQLAAFSAVAPLAWNGNLADAADGHNQAMIDADQQTHQAPGEPDLGQRATNAGYSWNSLGENVYAFSNDVAYGHAGFVIDWGYDAEDINGNQLYPDWQTRGDGMQDPPGHRTNLMSGNFTEVGISVVAENNGATQVGPQLITEDLGNRFGYQAQFVGVVIDDADGDEFYDIGEGLGGVTITFQRSGGGTYSTTSWASGGYQLAVPAGTYTITFSGGGLTAPVIESATIGSVNVKVDAFAAEGGGGNVPTEGDDVLTGTEGADTINALGGNDNVSGLGGADTIDGGTGADAMAGGPGDDTYVVDNAGDTVTEAAGEGDDLVRTGLASYTLGANVERLTYTGASGFAGTGNGLGNAITGGGSADTLSGLAGDDTLDGGAGNDTLNGGADNDTLIGGSGADAMSGGAGNDSYSVDNAGDTVTEASGEGTDTVNTSLASYTLGTNVERLSYTGTGNFTGTGNGLVNILTGGGANDTLNGGGNSDTLNGGGGNDTLDGGAGNDTMNGGSGNDIYIVDAAGDTVSEAAGQGEDTIRTGLASYTLGANVERLTYTGAGSFTGNGNALANTLTGGTGNDVLAGLVGDDVLVGGAGNDMLDGGADSDTASYAGAGAAVSVNLTRAAAQNTGGGGTDTLAGIENLTGSGFADTLIGDNNANVLDGGAGADEMRGGNGNDTYYVDNVGDKAVENASAGSDRVYASVTFSLAGQYTEALTLTGTAAINGTGNTQNNTITGNSAANVLVGGAGDDRLDGGAGADTMRGGLGADTFVIDQAGDIAQENAGEGTDTVEAWISYSLAGQNIEILKLMGTSNLNGTGNSLANTLTGNSGNNVLNGGGGADQMYGGAGDDRFVVDNVGDKVFEASGEGTDLVESSVTFSLAGQFLENLTLTGAAAINGTGNSFANILIGNNAANALNGGTGNDALHGGLGNDELRGGTGQDAFWFDTALGTDNVDFLADFSVADDALFLDLDIFTGIPGAGTISASSFRAGTTAQDADDRILYDSATGNIWYDSDGVGGAAAIRFATVAAGTALTYLDFVGQT